MGLDSYVHCNCYETGKVRTPPPKPAIVAILPDGDVDVVQGTALADALAFDKWKQTACEHLDMVLLSHRIGNISTVAFLRTELARQQTAFPLILSKVLYHGAHCGDWVPVELTGQLREEALRLKDVRVTTKESQQLMDFFAVQMLQLCDGAMSVSKPITF